MNTGHVTVRIYGENYPLRTTEPPARLEELASFVDARMREVAASGKVVVTSKIAVLAALHIADELFRLRQMPAPTTGSAELEQRLSTLVQTLERAMAPDRESAPPEL